MGITYRKLKEYLTEHSIKWQEIEKNAHVSWGAIAKINKNGYVDLETLEKIGRYLRLDIKDMIEIKNE